MRIYDLGCLRTLLVGSLLVCVWISIQNLARSQELLIYPADFFEGATIQDAINDGLLGPGDTLVVTGGPYEKGFNNDKRLNIIGDADGDETNAQVVIRASSDAHFVCPGNDCPLVLNRRGGTVENFVFEVDGTGVGNCHRLAFGGDDGGTWRNCVFRIVNHWPCDMNAFDITGGGGEDRVVLAEDCVMEQSCNTFSDVGDSALIRVFNNHHPVFNRCTIGGRGRRDRKAILMPGASADFNNCVFDTRGEAVADTGTYMFLEGGGQEWNLNDCVVTNDNHAYLKDFIFLSGGGGGGPALFHARRTRFHAPVGNGETEQTRLLWMNRSGAEATFENCSILWDATNGWSEGAVLFENHSASVLRFVHCTVVDHGPRSTGRFIEARNVTGSTIELSNSIFDGLVTDGAGGSTGLGLVFENPGAPSSEIDYIVSDNIRHDISDVEPGSEGFGNAEGMLGFTFVDPQVTEDNVHLSETSPAIGEAADLGIADDIDGDVRPGEGGLDIGADEFEADDGGLLVYPGSFPGLTLQEAHDDEKLSPGDTLLVGDYGPNNPFKGISNLKGLILKPLSGTGPFTISGAENADLAGDQLVSNHRGGRIENFVIEMNYTDITGAHHAVFAGDQGGVFANCTFRVTGSWGDGSLVSVGGGNPEAASRFESSVFEQSTLNDAGDGALLRVEDGYRPIFENCTFGGRGRDDRNVVSLVGGSAEFNDCTFRNDDDSGVTLFLEGSGQECVVTNCLFENPANKTLGSLLQLGAGGSAGAATFNCRSTRFHAAAGGSPAQTRLLQQLRDNGMVNFENCSIFWDALNGQAEGAVLLKDHSGSLLSFKHCTVVDHGPIPEGRFIEIRNVTNGTLELRNSIFDGLVDGGSGLGLVFENDAFPSSGTTINSSDNLRHDITQPLAGSEQTAMREGMRGFIFADPLLAADSLHLVFDVESGISPAVNAASDIGVAVDIDGDPRPGVTIPESDLVDIGADEFKGALQPLIFPDDFAVGRIQDAINDPRLTGGDLLVITGGPYFEGFNNDKALVIVGDTNGDGSRDPVLIQAETDANFTCPGDDCPLVLNRRGGTIDNFVFEVDGTDVFSCHRMAFGGDDGGIWRNCTFRITGIWPCRMNAFDITGGRPTPPTVLAENCVIEQTTTEGFDQGGALIRVTEGHHAVFTNCTISGRGRLDGTSAQLVNSSADFTGCDFINAGETDRFILVEGGGQTLNLTDCRFENPDNTELGSLIVVGPGGEAGVRRVTCRRSRFHAPVGSGPFQTRILEQARGGSEVAFENCSIWWDSDEGQPEGAILFENSTDASLTFSHCTVVNLGPTSEGRFVEVRGAADGSISFLNSIFDGRVTDGKGGSTGLGLVYESPDLESFDMSYIASGNIRNDIMDVEPGFEGAGNAEGMVGFLFDDPQLAADNVHLTPQSPAIDAGTDVGVGVDIDGEARPVGQGFDLGADEAATGEGVGPFIRGDCDGNGTVGGSPTEAIVLLNFAFRGQETPGCLAACDAEANGVVGITDALRILRHAFLGVGEPDPPFPDCVTSELESDVALGCETPLATCP